MSYRIRYITSYEDFLWHWSGWQPARLGRFERFPSVEEAKRTLETRTAVVQDFCVVEPVTT